MSVLYETRNQRDMNQALDRVLFYQRKMKRAKKLVGVLRGKVGHIGPDANRLLDELDDVLDYEKWPKR